MTFLNPIILFGIPLIALPILIHLLNQRRHKTVEWGAMRFLLSAKQMSKGMARFKHILILTARTLIVAGLIFALCRPLATGTLGLLAGGRPETVIILLDRSASMQAQNVATGQQKISAGLSKIANFVRTLGNTRNVVLIDNATLQATEVESIEALTDLPMVEPTDTAADIPALIQAGLDYVSDNQTGRTDIWVCSDARRNDWAAESERWQALRRSFTELEGIRFQVLTFADIPERNYSVVVESASQIVTSTGRELVLDMEFRRSSDITGETELPVEITINGTRTVVTVKMINEEHRLTGHRIPLAEGRDSGWGCVSLPMDSNTADDTYYFGFAKPAVRRTAIVCENREVVESLKIMSSVSQDPEIQMQADVFSQNEIANIDWERTALLIWQGEAPDESSQKQIKSFLDQGRHVLYFPSANPRNELWQPWTSKSEDDQTIEFWNSDQDLLSRTRDGDSLPVDKLRVYRHSTMNLPEDSGRRILARLQGGSPLVVRENTDAGAVYYVATLPTPQYSNMSRNGVVAYAMIRRSIESAVQTLGTSRKYEAGSVESKQVASLSESAAARPTISESRPFTAGVYESDDLVVALNRAPEEDAVTTLDSNEISSLFEGLDFGLVESELKSERSLASEIWRAFIVLACVALLLETVLCLPPKSEPSEEHQWRAAA